jgi:hypothetical protein
MNYSPLGCQIHQSSEVNSMVSIDVFFFLAKFCYLATQKRSLAPLSGVFPLFIYLFIKKSIATNTKDFCGKNVPKLRNCFL